MIRSTLFLSLLFFLSSAGHATDIITYQRDLLDHTPLEAYREDQTINPGKLTQLFTFYALLKSADSDSLSKHFQTPEEEFPEKILPLLSKKNLSSFLISINLNEDEFIERLNDEIQKLGLKNTQLVSAFDAPDNKSTAKEIALLTETLINEYPSLGKAGYFFPKDFERNTINLQGFSSVKDITGFAFGGSTANKWNAVFVSSNKYGTLSERRILSVVLNSKSSEILILTANYIIQEGYSNFISIPVFQTGDIVGKITVLNGETSALPVKVNQNIFISIPRKDVDNRSIDDFSISVKHNSLLSAPISKGDKVGTLTISFKNEDVFHSDVFAAQTVPTGGVLSRLIDNIKISLNPNNH